MPFDTAKEITISVLMEFHTKGQLIPYNMHMHRPTLELNTVSLLT